MTKIMALLLLASAAVMASAASPGCWVDPRWDESAAQFFPNVCPEGALR